MLRQASAVSPFFSALRTPVAAQRSPRILSPAAHLQTSAAALMPRNKNSPYRSHPEEEEEEDERSPDNERSTAPNNEKKVKADDGNGASSQGGSHREGSSAGNGNSNGDDDSNGDKPSPSSSLVSRNTVPAVYPQVLALPITRRPLFPGFYKAVVIKNQQVCAAIKEAMKRGQPYVGAFLLKDEEEDSDVITSLDRVHRVGVFAQITSIFPAQTGTKDGKDEEEGITAVLYPHRRIRIDELITPLPQARSSIEHEQDVVDAVGVSDGNAKATPRTNVESADGSKAPADHKVQDKLDNEVRPDGKHDVTSKKTAKKTQTPSSIEHEQELVDSVGVPDSNAEATPRTNVEPEGGKAPTDEQVQDKLDNEVRPDGKHDVTSKKTAGKTQTPSSIEHEQDVVDSVGVNDNNAEATPRTNVESADGSKAPADHKVQDKLDNEVRPDGKHDVTSKKTAGKTQTPSSIEHEQELVDSVGVPDSNAEATPRTNVEPEGGKAPTDEQVHDKLENEVRPDGKHDVTSKATAEKTYGASGDVHIDDADVEKGPDMPSHSSPFQTSFLHNYEVSLVNVSNLTMEPYDRKPNQYIRAVMSELISVFKDIANLNPLFRDQIANFSISQGAGNVFEEPEKLADFAAAVSSSEVDELQGVLQSMNVEDRLQKALLVLKKELMNAQLQSKISKDVENKIQKRQREYYLMEQLKGIKKELGLESDGKDKMVEKFKEKANELRMPESVRKVFDEELSKLQTLEPAASEFNVTRGYLEWLTNIPWGVHSPENYAIKHATNVLDEDHYGLNDVKDRILEFLAIGKLRGTVQGKIICLVGPPGVGKTSIGKSIARALERQFFRFSVGGLSDVAEIKGHRRTYVGAMPGKAIQALKKVGTENPLILIDEVDKVGRGYNGDPSSALLEMLDPEQNASFMDHYLDVPVDLSRVLFVCTANTLDTIPQPLLDRMEVIEVSSYTAEEKRHIARDYLAPQAKETSGLSQTDIQLPDDSIDFLIKRYARESGVRGLRKLLEKVYRKVAFEIVKEHGEEVFPEPSKDAVPNEAPAAGDEAPKVTTQPRRPMEVPASVSVVITPERLQKYLGPPLYQQDRLYTNTMPAGVALGLGYLGNGSGSLMPIETTLMPGKGRLQLTGKLGDVIKESASIALSWIKTHAHDLGITKEAQETLLENRDVHLHMPEGAVGKEGPSAGVAFATSLISLLTDRALPTTLAMTGEVSLRGMVLAVGGLKEKLLAAHRAGVETVILPAPNRPSVEADVPKSVLDDLDVHYVTNIWSALEIIFGEGPWSAQAKTWSQNEPPQDS